jgi:hypothetical protein
MSDFTPRENSVSIRNPATANFLIDSRDRIGYFGQDTQNQTFVSSGITFQSTIAVSQPFGQTSANFTINKTNSLLNGFFTRIGVQEIYLDYCVDNISAYQGNNTFIVQNINTLSTISAVLPNGNYTTQQAITNIAAQLNPSTISAIGGGISSFVSTTSGTTGLSNANYSIYFAFSTSGAAANYELLDTPLANQLAGAEQVILTSTTQIKISCPKLVPTSYLDFVCAEATQNQDIKDSSTSLTDRNILYRWYMAWEGPSPLDGFGYPIYMGQQPFVSRRSIAFPKQIRWSANQPIGQMSFQVLDDSGQIANPYVPLASTGEDQELEWAMTLLVSEN